MTTGKTLSLNTYIIGGIIMQVLLLNLKSGKKVRVEPEAAVLLTQQPKYTSILSGEQVSRKKLIQSVRMATAINATYGW